MRAWKPIGTMSGLLLGATLLAACGGGAAPASSPAAPSKPAASAAAPAAAPSSAKPAASSPASAAAPSSAKPAASAAAAPSSAKPAASAGASAPASAAAGASAPASAAAGAATLKAADNTKLGKILADGDGKILYTYDKDTPDTSTCSGGCASNWPAFKATSAPAAPSGFSGKVGLIASSQQVTLDSKPLYYFKADAAAGDAKGDGVGGVWHVVKAG